MNTTQITHLRDSFLRLMPEADALTDLFYARLFQLDPTLRALFPIDLYVQKGKLLRSLVVISRSLDCPRLWLPQIQQLGNRHRTYGVLPHHYGTFRAALFWTLETDMGEEFSPELREAWGAFYDEFVAVMQTLPDLTGFESNTSLAASAPISSTVTQLTTL